MTYIPNEDKPAEIESMWVALQNLRRCEHQGKWDAEGLVKWLKSELTPLEQALERLDEHLEQIYPGAEYQQEVIAQEAQREYQWSLKQAIDKESEVA